MVFDKLVSVEFLSNLKKSTITKNSEEAKKLEAIKKGKSTDGKKRILDVVPTSLHQRSPFFVGSEEMMQELESFFPLDPF